MTGLNAIVGVDRDGQHVSVLLVHMEIVCVLKTLVTEQACTRQGATCYCVLMKEMELMVRKDVLNNVLKCGEAVWAPSSWHW